MAKIQNVYQDKKTKKWFFKAYLGVDSEGKKIQKTKRGFASQKKAKYAYDQFMLTHNFNHDLSSILGSANQLTFEEFYKIRFVNWYEKTVKRTTFENAQFIYQKRLQYFYHIRVKDISSSDIEDWLFELSQTISRNSRNSKDGTLSMTYINRVLAHLRIVMKRAVSEGLIAHNPVDDVTPLPTDNKKVDFWELEEFQKAMTMFDGNNIQSIHRKIVYELLFFSGVRIGELQALAWTKVDFKKYQITIEKTLIYNGKRDYYFSTPKTQNAYRTIGIGKELMNRLKQWRELQSMIGTFEYVTQIDGSFTPSYSFANWLKEAARKVNVKPIKLHALRHSHVAFLIEQGVQPLLIQERLGHANINITLGTYGHLYAKSDNLIVNVIDSVFEN